MKEKTVDGIRMMVSMLEGLDAIDLGNELVAHLAPGVAAAAVGQTTMGAYALLEAIGLTSSALIGKLGALLPRVLAGTIVVAGGEKFQLSKGRDEINRLIAAHPLSVKPVVMFSLEAQFARFFPASVLDGLREKARSLSVGFSQSTSATGSSTG